jgi:hypothetical protein
MGVRLGSLTTTFAIVFLATLCGVLALLLYRSEHAARTTVIEVKVVSDPPGATLTSLSAGTLLGTSPTTIQYALPADWRNCQSYEGIEATWPSGVALDVKHVELCPEGGLQQEMRISAPVRRQPRPARTSPLEAPVARSGGAPSASQPSSNVAAPALPPPSVTVQAPASVQPTSLVSTGTAATPSRVAPVIPSYQGPSGGGSLNPGARIVVIVVGRQSSETGYSFVVPGYVSTRSNAYGNCYGSTNGSIYATTRGQVLGDTYRSTTDGTYSGSTYTSCTSSGNSVTTVTPAQDVSYAVSGATLSLRLPDGRVAVVNCDSKVNWTEWGGMPRRSCRIPATDQFQAEFNGEKAKLIWTVGISGEKEKSETYKLIEILRPAH